KVFADSTLIDSKNERSDITVYEVPATRLADENGLKGGANIILIGKMIAETGIISMNDIEAAFKKIVPPTKPQLIENNLKAINLGANYK
ncbi:MAG: 2-oxoacid:acceptor oxidoreductase family protein, partial [Oscillospiraceae bacterium]|nr:2-oxoacid:acceptor oxidoreductase family protein [Oscillospiraceae bacterium]